MRYIDEMTSLLVAQTPTGPIVRGGPGVAIATRGEWTVVTDTFGTGRATRARLEQLLDGVADDPIQAVFDGFARRALELFVFVGPPGVIAGSAPADARQRVVVHVDPDDATVQMGFGAIGISSDWLVLRAGTAVCWGPRGPQAVCKITHGTVEPWTSPALSVAS